MAGCHHAPPQPVVAESISDPSFVGNEACKPCHASEFTAHHLGAHDSSLHAATTESLGKLLPEIGVIPLGGYRLEKDGQALRLVRDSGGSSAIQSQNLDFVLGSGSVGMTYVSLVSDDRLMETRMSYFPTYKMWDITPGQEVHANGDSPFGREHPAEESRKCIGCHSTTLPIKGIRPERRFLGIGCESCHGPGKEHIVAATSGKSGDLHMARLGALTPSKLNEMCGKCHRTANNVDVDSPEVNLTHRFQPYALMRSACRTKANEPLSCLYCHDPHTNVSKDTKRYETVCLACHTAHGTVSTLVASITAADVRQSKVCPVNASRGCIECHMRPKALFPLTSIPAKMADHLITPPGADRARLSPRLSH